jgi:putative membrane protein
MIQNYNDHAANERTFLAWVRTGLSAIALGIVAEKGSLLALALAVADAGSPTLAEHTRDYLGNCSGPILVVAGIAVMLGASVRFLRTALRINDQNTHPASAVGVATALLRYRRRDSGAISPTATDSEANLKRSGLLKSTKRLTRQAGPVLLASGSRGLPIIVENLKDTKC